MFISAILGAMDSWTSLFDERGAQARLARQLGVTRQAVNAWKKNAYVPSDHASMFEAITGVPREKTCPDFAWAKPERVKQETEA